MQENLLHTPEGVRDIYGPECAKKIKLQNLLAQVLLQYGYSRIQTPAFEFFDVFNGERGTLPSREMYKFFDREGNTLVLRPDITPSIARAVAKYYRHETMPLRFSYAGNVFVNNSSYQGLMKESTQMGAEYIGEDSAAADGELIALAIELLKTSGLTRFVVDIGHAGFFKALMAQAGLSKDSEAILRGLIENKNFFGIENFLEEQKTDKELGNILMQLPKLSGSSEIFENIRRLTSNKEALAVIDRLEEIYAVVKDYGYEAYITFDLGMFTTYDYYTGVIFRGYTYGTGDALVKGGRYDHLVGQFGKAAPAVGFALVINQLMIALGRQKIDFEDNTPSIMILYANGFHGAAAAKAKELRAQGTLVTLMALDNRKSMEEYERFAKAQHIPKIMVLKEER